MIDFNQAPEELMKVLEKARPNQAEIAKAISQYKTEQHEILTNKTKFPDKIVETEEGTSTQPVNRIAVSIQKTIVDKAVAFAFGRAVTYLYSDEKTAQSIKDVLRKNKTNNLTREVAREVYATTHSAEIWYTVEDTEAKEGQPQRKLRVLHLKASQGDIFYPVFENGDLIAFVRELKKKDEEGKNIDYAEIYTAENKIILKKDGSWTEESRETNVIGKIPVIYASQPQPEWAEVQTMIDRLEVLISGHAEVNDYHFAPKLKARGNIKGFAKKGEKGAILEMEENADIDYLTWNQGTESLKLEFDNLWNTIFKMTQTPDISFENMTRLGAISGVAAQYYFMDAHLKVEMKREIWEDYLIRRINIIKAFISKEIDVKQENALNELEVDVQLNPYIINDLTTKIHDFSLAKNSGIMSLKTIVQKLGAVDDNEEELALLESKKETVV